LFVGFLEVANSWHGAHRRIGKSRLFPFVFDSDTHALAVPLIQKKKKLKRGPKNQSSIAQARFSCRSIAASNAESGWEGGGAFRRGEF
jgi:hypothetical protein